MQGTVGYVEQVNTSGGGVPKLPVDSAWVDDLGLDGDLHDDSENHGGRERAVCLYSLELLVKLRSEGHPAYPGSMGENLTVSGLDWDRIAPGARLRVGDDLLLQVTSYTTPCSKIARSFSDRRFARVSQKVNPGESRVYARVLSTGEVRKGDEVHLLGDE